MKQNQTVLCNLKENFAPMRKYQKEVSDQKSEEKQTCLLSRENAAGTLGSVNWHLIKFLVSKFSFLNNYLK